MKEVGVVARQVDFALNIHAIEIQGVLDGMTAPLLEETIRAVAEKGVIRIVLDMKGVDQITSAGWRVVFAPLDVLRDAGGDLKVAGLSPEIELIFHLLGFDRLLFAYDSVGWALAGFRDSALRMGAGWSGISRGRSRFGERVGSTA